MLSLSARSTKLLLCTLALTLAGCPSSSTGPASPGGPSKPGTKRIMFVTNGDDPFWDACLSGLNEGAKQHKLAEAGLSVHRDVNNGTAEGQIEKLRQYATQDDIAGVAISVIQADNLAIIEEMRKLQKKGVKIITVDGDVNRDAVPRRPHATTSAPTTSSAAARWARRPRRCSKPRASRAGGYVQFAGFTDNDNARSRMNGVKETIGEAYTEKDRMPDGMDLTKARDNVRNAIQNHQGPRRPDRHLGLQRSGHRRRGEGNRHARQVRRRHVRRPGPGHRRDGARATST